MFPYLVGYNPCYKAIYRPLPIPLDMENSTTAQPAAQANGLETISFKVSKVDSTWARYSLHEASLVFGAPGSYRESGYKAILRGSDPSSAENVAIVSKDYALLPNEEVQKAALSAVEGTPMKQVSVGYGAHGNSLFMQYADYGRERAKGG